MFAKIPISKIGNISIIFGNGKTMEQVKNDIGCDYILNGGLYDMTTGHPVGHLKTNGKIYASEKWGCWGYAWNTGSDIEMKQIPSNTADKNNYISCVSLLSPWDGMDAKISYSAALGGKRGRSAMAMTDDSLILYCSQDGKSDVATPEMLRESLHKMGAKTALMLDSGGSCQCDFGGRNVILSGRRVNNYICVWLKKENQPPTEEKEDNIKMDKSFTVCLDPGHGPGTVNGSPDGTYKESEFTWDMYKRISKILEGKGVNVICTRKEDSKPSLNDRCKVSNNADTNLFVSLHSNAADNSGWSNANGLMIYTSMAGDKADRNIAARYVIDRMEADNIDLHGVSALSHYGYTVLTNTVAPAILIEYGFHTNKGDVENLKNSDYRDRLAKNTVAGILDFLGVSFENEDKEEGVDKPADWAKKAWDTAVQKGIFDGTAPQGAVTREMLAVILSRLNLI